MSDSRILQNANLAAAVLLLLGAVTNVLNLRAGLDVALNLVDLLLTVFMATLLIKRTRTWVCALPFGYWTAAAFLAGSGPVAVLGDVLMNGLTCLMAVALLTPRLPGLRNAARRWWYVPAALGYLCRLIHWTLAISRGEAQGRLLLAAILLVTAVDLGYLLAGKWFAEGEDGWT